MTRISRAAGIVAGLFAFAGCASVGESGSRGVPVASAVPVPSAGPIVQQAHRSAPAPEEPVPKKSVPPAAPDAPKLLIETIVDDSVAVAPPARAADTVEIVTVEADTIGAAEMLELDALADAAVRTHADLWARIRAGFAMPELDTPLVARSERYYLTKPDYLQRMFARGSRYLHFIVEEIEKRGMPMELALLPFVESAMNPVALSHAKAAGLWQFIPETGRRYELSQDWWVDERRDVVRSTRAALDYLQAIHDMHGGDWFLALASYNWGENAVARAVRANRAAGRPADYLNLRMPNETRHYVPKLIALKNILLRADELKIALPALPDQPYFKSITKSRPIDLKLAASFAGMTMDEFVALNPSHNRPVIAATGDNRIRLPADRVDAFAQAMAAHLKSGKPLASWQPYTLQAGESVADVARRARVPVADVLKANGLRAGARVLAGSQLIAPQPSVKDEMRIRSFNGPRVYQRVDVPAAYHLVRKGETLATVAARHRLRVADLRRWNGNRAKVPAGTRLLVRPAQTRTVLTTIAGERPVVVRTGGPAAAAAARATPARATPARATPEKPATRRAASAPGGPARQLTGSPARGKPSAKAPPSKKGTRAVRRART